MTLYGKKEVCIAYDITKIIREHCKEVYKAYIIIEFSNKHYSLSYSEKSEEENVYNPDDDVNKGLVVMNDSDEDD